MTVSPDPLLPWTLVLPAALVAEAVIAGHLLALAGRRDAPPSRRRIRAVTGAICLLTAPIVAIGAAGVAPADHRAFTLVWTAAMGLLFVVLLMAAIDGLNNARLGWLARRDVRRRVAEFELELIRELARRRVASGSTGRERP